MAELTGRDKARMERVAHAIVTSDRGSAVFFVLLAVGLVAFGLYMLGQAILFANELRLLRGVLAVLGVGFAGALIYEAVALWVARCTASVQWWTGSPTGSHDPTGSQMSWAFAIALSRKPS